MELLAFSASSWTEACRSTSTAYLTLWGVPLIASCKTSCAYKQADAELDSVRLALGLARHTKSLLQHLGVDQLDDLVNISLKTSSWNCELVTGRPLAMQLGLSRRNKHIQLRSEKGQLQLSKVHPDKNLAHSLTNNASDKRMLAKLRVTEAAEILALSTVRGQGLASLGSSSSFLVGMVAVEPPKMDQLRQLALPKSVSDSFERTCFESLPRNFAESLTLTSWSLPIDSLTLPSLSRTGDRFHSLTLHSLSLPRGNLDSLTLQSLSLIDENRFQRISFKEVIFGNGSLEETDENLAHKLADRRAGTNSFSNLAVREVGTNSFSNKSFSERILSLQMRLQTFLFRSFQLTCAALLLGTYSVLMSFPNESLQSDELVAAYSRDSFQHQCLQQDELEVAYMHGPTRASQLQHHSLQQKELCRSSFQSFSDQLSRIILDSLIIQLDLVTSLSLTWFGSTRCRQQLQSDSFDRSSFEHRALPCAALLAATLVAFSLGAYQHKSFQLPMQQLYLSWTQGGAYPHRALSAWTLISLSFAIMLGSKLQARELGSEDLCQQDLPAQHLHHSFHNNIHQISNKKLEENLAFNGLVQLLDQQHLHWQQLLEKRAC